MEEILRQLHEYLSQFEIPYQLVDIEGWILFSYQVTAQSNKQAVNINQCLNNPEQNVFSIMNTNLLVGYIITSTPLSTLEKKLLHQQIETITKLRNLEKNTVNPYTLDSFWKNILYNNVELSDINYYTSRYNITQHALFILVYFKIAPDVELNTTDAKHIQTMLRNYCTISKTMHAVIIHPGELVLIVEIPLAHEHKIDQFKRDVKTHEETIILQLRSLKKLAHAHMIIGLSEPIRSFSELPEKFLILKNFLRTAIQLHPHSRVIRYENAPLYSLLQNLPFSAVQEFVSTIFKNKDCLPKEMSSTLKALFNHNLNISQAAQALGIHRNTLEYRIQKIHEQTQHDPMDFYHAMQLLLAIQLKELYNI